MRPLFLILVAAASLLGQTILSNCPVHPRLIFTDCVPGTDAVSYPGGQTTSSNGRLKQVADLATAGSGEAWTDFQTDLSKMGPAGTSTTSLATGTGTKAFTYTGLMGGIPGWTFVANSSSTGEFMVLTAVSYVGSTLTATSAYAEGTGTHADWQLMSVPTFNEQSDQTANENYVVMYSYPYAIYHRLGRDDLGAVFAAATWAAISPGYADPVFITSCTGNGTTMTCTVPSTATLTTGQAGVWGFSNDALNGASPDGGGYVNIVIDSGTQFHYANPVNGGPFAGGGIAMVTQAGPWKGGVDQPNSQSMLGTGWAYFYDLDYSWLVAHGHDTFARNQMKQAHWNVTPTKASSQWLNNQRDSDFHNYPSQSGQFMLEAGTAMLGDDSEGASILLEGYQYLVSGLAGIVPATGQEAITFNVAKSNTVLSDCYLNMEGSQYFRNGMQRVVRSLEAFDSGTGRANGIWTDPNKYGCAGNAKYYEIYNYTPNGTMASFGDQTPGTTYSGKDMLMALYLNNRFPDAHLMWILNNPLQFGDWYDGNSFQIMWEKLALYFYTNSPGIHDFTDLPLSRQMGPDLVIRTGWGPTDTYWTYTDSLPGVYHRHEDFGNLSLFKMNWIMTGQPYAALDYLYTNYRRRPVGAANGFLIQDPADCWENKALTCGIDSDGSLLENSGGGLYTLRRFWPEFPTESTPTHQLLRLWSGTVYSDSTALGSGTISSVYKESLPLVRAAFAAGTGYEHLRDDLTAAYVNSFSGTADHPTAKVVCVKQNGVCTQGYQRELTHFQSFSGGAWSPMVDLIRVNATSSAFKKSISMHVPNPPAFGTSSQTPGDTGPVTSVPQMHMDSSPVSGTSGRVFVTSILPAAPTVRSVGGNACAPKIITGMTNANPGVFTIPGHGLVTGEVMVINAGLDYHTFNHGYQALPIDYSLFGGFTAVVIDTDHVSFLNGSGNPIDTTAWTTWANAFSSGTGAPTIPGASYSVVGSGPGSNTYYQTDAAAGNTVWRYDTNAAAWINNGDGSGILGPTVFIHQNCSYEYFVDQNGPSGSGGAFLWQDFDPDPTIGPQYRVTISPPSPSANDVFLTVYNPTTATTGAPPSMTAVSGTSVVGVQITDGSAGTYVAAASTSMLPQLSLSYTATHAGAAQHVATGLLASNNYAVTQGGTLIASVTSDASGAVPFTETGGGNFVLVSTSPAQQPGVISSGINAAGVVK